MKKILIIRFSSIGDIVLTTPVVRCVKKQLNAEVHYLTKKQFIPILEENPYINHVHAIDDNNFSEVISKLKKVGFDHVVDLHKNLRSKRVLWALNKPSTSFDKLNVEKWLLVNLKVNYLPNIHIVDRYFDAVGPLNIYNDNEGLDYFIPEKDEIEYNWLPEEFRNEYAALAIGGQHATKRLPIERLIELCDRINKPIILLGGKEDSKNAQILEEFFNFEKTEEIKKGLKEANKKTIIFNGCGKFNINQSAYLVRNAKTVFTHDTGLMHIAAAFKKKVYSIWGNTVPEFGMYPYQTKFVIWENKNLSCRPCSKLGKKKCPKGHFKCMNGIKFDF